MNACNASGFNMLFSQSITPSVNFPINFRLNEDTNEFVFEVKNNFHTLENLWFECPSRHEKVFLRVSQDQDDIFLGTTEHVIFYLCDGFHPLYNFLSSEKIFLIIKAEASSKKIINARCTRCHLNKTTQEKLKLMPSFESKSLIGFNENLFSYFPLEEKQKQIQTEINFTIKKFPLL